MDNTHPRLRKSTKVDPEIMAQPLEPNTAHEHDALLGDQGQRESNGDESTEFRDTTHLKSKRALFLDNSVVRVLKITLGCSYSNLLLPFVFLGILAGSLGWDDSISFFFNFLAILPLAALLSFATEELAKSVGQTVGGLINATFGNAVEMIVGINAVRQGQISIVQSSMVGSILSGNLLILGVSLFCSGYAKEMVKFNVDVSGILSSLMVVSSATLIIPSVLYSTIQSNSQEVESSVLSLSRVASVVLLTLYLVYLYFQLKSHSELFVDDKQEEEEERVLGPWPASIILILATLGVTLCSDRLVNSVDGFVDKWHVSRAFIGLIVVPIVGNAGEFNTVINSSIKGNMDLAIGVIVGSTLQIALFVSPFLVMCGWVIGQPMSLRYSPFETVVFFLSVIVMDCLIRGGRSNYYEGTLLAGTYLIIAIAFYVHPDAVDAPFV
ncbi:Sodium/calcium exchanger membrane region [Penicillium griseofulvum]|uniref:Vacuolar calcium ion transporter n=1 Tax=Penicillium patulum TaxID=5078 RepID=A0A135LFK0_PENPA|nr:Sodium/calcium exchanger membrane region [Penicillium griseofulvum]KXG47766.1 Sodium/calcium exchanger membrane region [Penicillium griseofulvum]